MPLGYLVYGQDNQSLMYYKAEGLRTCLECGYKIDFEYVNPKLRIKKRIYDFSYTFDKCCIVSAKFKKFCEENNYHNIVFFQLPQDPDFYFFESGFENLSTLDTEKIRFPVVLKPCVGFLSMGVYIIRNAKEWIEVIKNLRDDIEKFRGQFPTEVVDASSFIVEELINGEEFAIDAYFDKDGKPVILNIFKHPFSGETDVSDRVYFTSGEIIKSNHERFEHLLLKIGDLAELRNFPLHMEVRVDAGKVMPIEINPMRFAGWCVTDLAYFAYGIDVYEYYFEQKSPDWEKILKDRGGEFYYFTIAEVPVSLDKSEIKDIDYNAFLKNISHPLEVRKIDYRRHPIFAIVFAKTDDYSEMSNILKKNMKDFIITG